MSTCEVCDKRDAVGVACVPMAPISCAYCTECLAANAHPWYALVANTACIGGLENANGNWKKMVQDTCTYLNKTLEDFNKAVQESIDIADAAEAKEIEHETD